MTSNSVPPEKPKRWDERLRENPLVVVVLVTAGVAFGLNGLKAFATDTAPWLVSFLAPVADFIARIPPELWVGLLVGMLVASFLSNVRREVRIQSQEQELQALKAEVEELQRTSPPAHAPVVK